MNNLPANKEYQQVRTLNSRRIPFTEIYGMSSRSRSKQIDCEFDKDLQAITRNLNRLPQSKRKVLLVALSNLMETYLTQKVEKELNRSLKKVFSVL